jgi:hypothetical protein
VQNPHLLTLLALFAALALQPRRPNLSASFLLTLLAHLAALRSYVQNLLPTISKWGICKVVPPTGWTPQPWSGAPPPGAADSPVVTGTADWHGDEAVERACIALSGGVNSHLPGGAAMSNGDGGSTLPGGRGTGAGGASGSGVEVSPRVQLLSLFNTSFEMFAGTLSLSQYKELADAVWPALAPGAKQEADATTARDTGGRDDAHDTGGGHDAHDTGGGRGPRAGGARGVAEAEEQFWDLLAGSAPKGFAMYATKLRMEARAYQEFVQAQQGPRPEEARQGARTEAAQQATRSEGVQQETLPEGEAGPGRACVKEEEKAPPADQPMTIATPLPDASGSGIAAAGEGCIGVDDVTVAQAPGEGTAASEASCGLSAPAAPTATAGDAPMCNEGEDALPPPAAEAVSARSGAVSLPPAPPPVARAPSGPALNPRGWSARVLPEIPWELQVSGIAHQILFSLAIRDGRGRGGALTGSKGTPSIVHSHPPARVLPEIPLELQVSGIAHQILFSLAIRDGRGRGGALTGSKGTPSIVDSHPPARVLPEIPWELQVSGIAHQPSNSITAPRPPACSPAFGVFDLLRGFDARSPSLRRTRLL